MEEYDIEPFMPGISPIGKGTSAMKEFSVARPYIPDGTGYNMLRPKPGASKLRKNLEGLGRVSYDVMDSGDRLYKVEKPPSNYLKKYTTPDDYWDAVKSFDKHVRGSSNYGWYSPSKDTLVVKDDANKPLTTRHEIAHALQNRRRSNIIPRPTTHTVTGEELEARIVEKKGIRKGMQDWARDVPYYKDYYKSRDLPGQGKLREIAAKGMGKAAELIPNKPGNFTGRVPSFQGMGAGLVDMFSFPTIPPSMPMPHETHDIFGNPIDQGFGIEPEMIPSHNEYDYEIERLEYPDQGGTVPMTYGPKMVPNPRAGKAISPYAAKYV